MKKINEKEIINEKFEGISSKQRINKVLNYHKKLLKKTPKILAYTCNDQIAFENLQLFTDGYFAVALSKNDSTPIPDYKEMENHKNYPMLEKFFPTLEDCEKRIKVSYDSIMQVIKNYKIIAFDINGINVYFSKENMLHFLEFMNFKKRDYIIFNFNHRNFNIYPTLVIKENGTKGVILPIFLNNEYLEYKKIDYEKMEDII